MRSRVGKSAEITWQQAHANERRWDRIGLPGLALCVLALIAEAVRPGFVPVPVSVVTAVATAITWGRSMYWHGFHTGLTHGQAAERRATRRVIIEQRAQADG